MSSVVIDASTEMPPFGVRFRRPVGGPERELVDWFLDRQPIRVPRHHRLTIFVEPKLESGFPDLVAVIWLLAATRRWNPLRASLEPSDIRLMHYIFQEGPSPNAKLTDAHGPKVSSGLKRLEASEMIRYTGRNWVSRPLPEIFAVRQIISIEAKVREWDVALEQAHLNTWFASESFVLVPRIPRGAQLLDVAAAMGIGVWAMNKGLVGQPSMEMRRLPRSYASWLFNEWAWRADHHFSKSTN